MAQAREEFRTSVDAYLAHCAKAGKAPDRSFSGKFNVRLSPAQHRALAVDAEARRVSLNDAVRRAVAEYLERAGVTDPYDEGEGAAKADAKPKGKGRRKAEPVGG